MVMFLQKPLVKSVHSEQANLLTVVGQKHFTTSSVSSLVFLTWTLSGRPCHVDVDIMSGSEVTPLIHGHECFLCRLTPKKKKTHSQTAQCGSSPQTSHRSSVAWTPDGIQKLDFVPQPTGAGCVCVKLFIMQKS